MGGVQFSRGSGCPSGAQLLGTNTAALFAANFSASVCSGHGACVPASNNNNDSSGGGECRCEWGWTGRSDIYNLDAVDCQQNRILEQVLYAFLVLAWVRLLLLGLKTLRYQYRSFKRKLDKSHQEQLVDYRRTRFGEIKFIIKKAMLFLPFQVLIPIVFVGAPSMIIYAVLRACTLEIPGVDIMISFFLSFGVTVNFVCSVPVQYAGLKSIALGTQQPVLLDQVKRSKKPLYFITVFNCVVHFVTTLCPAIFVQTFSSFESRAVMYLVRNIMGLILVIYFFILHRELQGHLKILIRNLEQEESSISNPKSASLGILLTALQNLRLEIKDLRNKTIAATVLYLLFFIPYLWGFFSISSVVTLIFVTGKSHPVFWYSNGSNSGYKRHRKKVNAASSDSNNNQPNTSNLNVNNLNNNNAENKLVASRTGSIVTKVGSDIL